MGKEFYSDAIKLLKSMARGNQSSKSVIGTSTRQGRMRGDSTTSRQQSASSRRPAPSRPAPSRPGRGGKRKGGKV